MLRPELRLFDAVVSSTVLYGIGAWTMTAARETKLQTNLRKMLRRVIATPPMRAVSVGGVDEPYVEWISRATRKAVGEFEKAGFHTWVHLQKLRKTALLQKTVGSTDGRWSKAALDWTPAGRRAPGRPLKRWTDGVTYS